MEDDDAHLGAVGTGQRLITGVSPCVLPMIPIVFVTGGAGDTTATAARAQWVRPLLIIVGIVLSFGTIALLGTLVLSALHLPTGSCAGRGSRCWLWSV